ncbi:hypothetical protein CLM82_30665, partial [Streptomyces albidoflavus]
MGRTRHHRRPPPRPLRPLDHRLDPGEVTEVGPRLLRGLLPHSQDELVASVVPELPPPCASISRARTGGQGA